VLTLAVPFAIALSFALTLVPSGVAAAAPAAELPVRLATQSQSLNGMWAFKYVAGLDAGQDEAFAQPGFDAASWATLPVPGHWELHGYSEPGYFNGPPEGLGLYRRVFRVPEAWRGQRVFVCFDGVLHGFTAAVNGKEIGTWASGFNPVTFDITDALLPGDADNLLTVKVSTRSRGWDFDTMDCWSLSGIYRDVTLFAVPTTHVTDYWARTTLGADGSARLAIDVAASAPGTLTGTLTPPGAGAPASFSITLDDSGRGATTLDIPTPQLWTAETPALYRIALSLAAADGSTHRVEDRIGLREVSIKDGVLLLNGKPIKLRGINHHDIWPEEGRVATVARMRRDLELMREANINFVRTSHYPPHPLFIGMCDELGFYVDCEVPFIHGREHLTDPAYQEDLFIRARATLARDKNHPSIIFWSLGNENPVNEQGLEAGKLVKQLDPTRPIAFPTVGSHFKGNWEKYPEFVELYTPHYAGPSKVREYAETLARPIIVTEFAHQRGIARGGDGVQEIWDEMMNSSRVAGGAVWLFQDQGILRTADDRHSVKNGDLMVWLDEHRYFDTHGYYGVDGIVFSDRTPQADYWHLRHAFSPVQIREREIAVEPGRQTLTLQVKNRFDFRSLAGMKLAWRLLRNTAEIAHGETPLNAPARGREKVSLEITLPSDPGQDVFALEIRCLDAQGRSFNEHGIRLDTSATATSRLASLEHALPAGLPTLDVTDATISVAHPAWRLTVDRPAAALSITTPDGTPLVTAAGPHTSRKLTITELGKQRDGGAARWEGELMREVAMPRTTAEQTASGVVVTIAGRYPRPGFPDQAVEGECRLTARATGAIEVTYDYRPVNATGTMVETGYTLAIPAAYGELRWIGQGPYAGYKGRDRVNRYGVFQLNRDDLFFPGNRRGVQLACLSDQSGRGPLVAGDQAIFSFDNRGAETVVTHVASDSRSFDKKSDAAQKPETTKPETAWEPGGAASGPPPAAIKGTFTLVPLSGSWPAPLAGWFGPAGDRAVVHRPFLHVYDQ
jgi:beta-galactosidase